MGNCKGCHKGIGDTMAMIIKLASGGRIKECGGCKKRKKWLNEKIPYNNTLIGMYKKKTGDK